MDISDSGWGASCVPSILEQDQMSKVSRLAKHVKSRVRLLISHCLANCSLRNWNLNLRWNSLSRVSLWLSSFKSVDVSSRSVSARFEKETRLKERHGGIDVVTSTPAMFMKVVDAGGDSIPAGRSALLMNCKVIIVLADSADPYTIVTL